MKIPIVNENDELIGHKERFSIDYTSDIFRTASLWITNNKGEVLLAQRKFDKKVDPGRWGEAVGGTVEGDDSYEETVLREAVEELGISGLHLSPGPKQFITVPCSYFVQWYVATINKPIEDFTLQQDEVEEIAWVPLVRLKEELKINPKKYVGGMQETVQLLAEE